MREEKAEKQVRQIGRMQRESGDKKTKSRPVPVSRQVNAQAIAAAQLSFQEQQDVQEFENVLRSVNDRKRNRPVESSTSMIATLRGENQRLARLLAQVEQERDHYEGTLKATAERLEQLLEIHDAQPDLIHPPSQYSGEDEDQGDYDYSLEGVTDWSQSAQVEELDDDEEEEEEEEELDDFRRVSPQSNRSAASSSSSPRRGCAAEFGFTDTPDFLMVQEKTKPKPKRERGSVEKTARVDWTEQEVYALVRGWSRFRHLKVRKWDAVHKHDRASFHPKRTVESLNNKWKQLTKRYPNMKQQLLDRGL
jgi:hypothetical protein